MSAYTSRHWSAEKPLRVAVADDQMFFVRGLADALSDGDVQVVLTARTGAELLTRMAVQGVPDLIVMDVRMPPDGSDSGLRAAREIRDSGHRVPILILSGVLHMSEALTFFREEPEAVGYLSKDGATDLDRLLEAFDRLLSGRTVVDDDLVQMTMAKPKTVRAMEALSPREKEVLALVAQGRSDKAIGRMLRIEESTVQGHVGKVMTKVGLPVDDDVNRRVRAALVWIDAGRFGVVEAMPPAP